MNRTIPWHTLWLRSRSTLLQRSNPYPPTAARRPLSTSPILARPTGTVSETVVSGAPGTVTEEQAADQGQKQKRKKASGGGSTITSRFGFFFMGVAVTSILGYYQLDRDLWETARVAEAGVRALHEDFITGHKKTSYEVGALNERVVDLERMVAELRRSIDSVVSPLEATQGGVQAKEQNVGSTLQQHEE